MRIKDNAAFSRIKTISLILLGFILTLAAGCSRLDTPPTATSSKENTHEYVHKNGLTIRLPENFFARDVDEGFIVEPAADPNKSVRYPVQVHVILKKEEKTPGGYAHSRQRTIGSRTIKYSIDKNEGGGSGGAEYNLTAYESTAKGILYYTKRRLRAAV